MHNYLIKDLMNVNRGSSPRPIMEYLSDSGYRWLKISDFNLYDRYVYETKEFIKEAGLKNTRHLPAGTLILTNSATPGIPIFLGKDMCLHDGFLYFTNINENIININFLYYWFLYNRNLIINQANGSVFKNLKKDIVENFEIKVPDINIQLKIIKILDNINSKIELNNEINNNLYEMCNVLYHQLLDDNESNIEYKTIGEIAKKVITGKTPSTKNKEYWGGNIPFITIPDMHNQVFTINTERYITKEGAKSLIPKNSISVSCIATVGLVSINDKDSQTNQQINSIVIENDYDLYYLFEFLTEQEQYMKSIAGGSTTYNINKNTFENIQVPYLNKELIIEYDKKVRPMFEKIKSNQILNDTLSQLRDTLLPKLMNGEIDLDNIEI